MKKYGKFDTLQALLTAYASLEAEFTKRCQTMAQLQKEIDSLTAEITQERRHKRNEEENAEKKKEEIIREYLISLPRNGAVAFMPHSSAVPLAPVKRPHTLKEAKELADYFIRRN